jgi:outer membrane protein
MNKRLLIGGAVWLLCWSGARPAWAGELKVATIDAERLIKTYHKTGLAESHMKEQVEDFSKEEEKMLAQRRQLKKEFEAARTAASNRVLTEEARDKRMEIAESKLMDWMEYENKLRETKYARTKQLEDEQRRWVRQLVDEIREVVRDYSRKNGYTLIFDTSGITANGFEPVVYALDTLDVTADIEKLLNKDKAKVKATEP